MIATLITDDDLRQPPFCPECDGWYEWEPCTAGCDYGLAYASDGVWQWAPERRAACHGLMGVWVCPSCALIASRRAQ